VGAQLAHRIAAVAPVVASLPAPLAVVRPTHPVGLLLVHGTADPVVPYGGGPGQLPWQREPHGSAIGAWPTIALGIARTGCGWRAEVSAIDAADDGTVVVRHRWTGDQGGAEVVLMTVHGGGHEWPGNPRPLPRWLAGRCSSDVSAAEESWAFFSRHRR